MGFKYLFFIQHIVIISVHGTFTRGTFDVQALLDKEFDSSSSSVLLKRGKKLMTQVFIMTSKWQLKRSHLIIYNYLYILSMWTTIMKTSIMNNKLLWRPQFPTSWQSVLSHLVKKSVFLSVMLEYWQSSYKVLIHDLGDGLHERLVTASCTGRIQWISWMQAWEVIQALPPIFMCSVGRLAEFM